MNICIGGPLNSCKLIGKKTNKDFFTIKDRSTKSLVRYLKKRIEIRGRDYVFWLSEDMLDVKEYEIIKKYIHNNV